MSNHELYFPCMESRSLDVLYKISFHFLSKKENTRMEQRGGWNFGWFIALMYHHDRSESWIKFSFSPNHLIPKMFSPDVTHVKLRKNSQAHNHFPVHLISTNSTLFICSGLIYKKHDSSVIIPFFKGRAPK